MMDNGVVGEVKSYLASVKDSLTGSGEDSPQLLVGPSLIKSSNSSTVSPFASLVRKRASRQGDILISYFDLPFLDTALNFYETSLKRTNLTNFVFAGSHPLCCEKLNALDPGCCIVYREDAASSSASKFDSVDFIRKMNIRTDMILEALGEGLNVLHSDIDIYYVKNPFEHINCRQNRDCDIATLYDTFIVNAGFLYVRPTKYGVAIYEHMRQLSVKNPKMDDQNQLRIAIETLKKKKAPGFKHILLSENHFQCGQMYFEKGHRTFVGDNPCVDCVVIHNNWIVSREAKEYRARETGLWDYDGGEYFSSTRRKYLIFSNPFVFDSDALTKDREKESLSSALAIASLLKRTLILPRFHCASGVPCSILSHYRLTHFFSRFPVEDIRENSFLLHAKVPQSVKDSRSKPYFIASKPALDMATKHNPQFTIDDVVKLEPADADKGATSSEIVRWLQDDQSSVLEFYSLYSAFYKFDDDVENAAFQKKLDGALQTAVYRQY